MRRDLGSRCLKGCPNWLKPGDHPNFRKDALGVKRPFSELSESSGGNSRSSSRNWKFHSRNTKFHSRNGLSRLDQYEAHNSRSNPPERFSFAPAFSERFFKNWGGPRAPENWLNLEGREPPLTLRQEKQYHYTHKMITK